MTIVTTIYTEPEDINAAVDMGRAIIQKNRFRPSTASASAAQVSQAAGNGGASQISSGIRDAPKVAHNVAMLVRRDRFTGDIGESWNECVAEYQQIARDYNIGNQKKLQCLHNIMAGDAKRFYQNGVATHVNSFNHAVELIGRQYNSTAPQNNVKNVLNQLLLQDKLSDSQDEGEALAKVYKIIRKLSPQVPSAHRGNAHKIEFLKNAVLGRE